MIRCGFDVLRWAWRNASNSRPFSVLGKIREFDFSKSPE